MKDYDYYRKRSVICTVISISTMLIGGGLLMYFVATVDKRPIVPDVPFYIAIALCFIGMVTFFIGMTYEQKCNIELSKKIEERKTKEMNKVIDLIGLKKTQEAIKAFTSWVDRFNPVKKI